MRQKNVGECGEAPVKKWILFSILVLEKPITLSNILHTISLLL